MDNVKVVLVEDEPIIAADLTSQLIKQGLTVLGSFEDGEGVLEYLKMETPDIILMDVKLFGDLDGIDVANQINKKYQIPIIFLTSNTDSTTFNRAKLTFPHAFLSKPFRISDILHSIELAIEESHSVKEKNHEILEDRIFIKNRDSLEKVLFSKIFYIKAEGAYTKVVTEEKEYILSQTLKKTEERITANYLFRIHRSFIININNVDRISEGHLYIGKNRIPLSRTYRDEVLQLFKTL